MCRSHTAVVLRRHIRYVRTFDLAAAAALGAPPPAAGAARADPCAGGPAVLDCCAGRRNCWYFKKIDYTLYRKAVPNTLSGNPDTAKRDTEDRAIITS